MLIKSLYEPLPYLCVFAGVVSILSLKPIIGVASAIVLFLAGAQIYSLRSQNRRTDSLKKRKKGRAPSGIYNLSPFLYLLAATLVFKYAPSGLGPIVGICLMSYSLYIIVQRKSYRKHLQPNAQSYPMF